MTTPGAKNGLGLCRRMRWIAPIAGRSSKSQSTRHGGSRLGAGRLRLQELIAQVLENNCDLRELDEHIALARQTTASREETLRIFPRRVEVGSASRLNLTQAQALGAQLEQAHTLQEDTLPLLVGAPLDLAPATERLEERQMLRRLNAGLPSELLAQRGFTRT